MVPRAGSYPRKHALGVPRENAAEMLRLWKSSAASAWAARPRPGKNARSLTGELSAWSSVGAQPCRYCVSKRPRWYARHWWPEGADHGLDEGTNSVFVRWQERRTRAGLCRAGDGQSRAIAVGYDCARAARTLGQGHTMCSFLRLRFPQLPAGFLVQPSSAAS